MVLDTGRVSEDDPDGFHDGDRVPPEAVGDNPSYDRLEGAGQTSTGRHRDRVDHGDVRRVPYGEDAAVPHTRCHMPGTGFILFLALKIPRLSIIKKSQIP